MSSSCIEWQMAAREHINEIFNGRGFMLLCALAMVAVTAFALAMGVEPSSIQGKGLFFSLHGIIIAAGPLSAGINVLCLLATGAILLALNKVFAFIRSVTHLFVSAFFLLQIANPSGLVAFNAGTLLCLVAAMTLLPLFASFQDSHAQRSIFLIFALVAAGAMFHHGFLVLIPAYLLGFANMRALGLKGLLAMLFGLVTPFWIVLGLGIASPMDITAPSWWPVSVPRLDLSTMVIAATIVLGLVLAAANLLTILNYRMQTRVYNVFFIILLVTAVIASCLDYRDVAVFLPLLNLMVAVQVAQAHVLRTSFHYRYVLILLFTLACLAIAAAHLLPV